MPRVTVLMPLFNGLSYIEESLQSIQAQTYTDWEFIIVNDFGSDDGCAAVVERYAKDDPRIKLVQLEERLGLAASLNVGLDMARGEYVARVDVDDPSEPERLEKQVAFMDAHPELVLCSCWQYSQTPNAIFVQKVAYEPQELKAAMLFGCEVSHCGVMLRLADFNAHGWRYDPSYLGEDFELWNRVLAEGANMANIPEALVTHRWGYENISIEKGEALREEVRALSMGALERIGVRTWKYDPFLFSGWRNMPTQYRTQDRDIFLREGFALLQEIYEKNRETKYVGQDALKKILLQRWDWIRKTCGFQYTPDFWELVRPMEAVPRVSVVMPTYNSVETISITIDSLLAQTYTNWELLVVNDFGSDDGTAEIVRAYARADPRIRLIQAEARLGLAESLNLGMREAKGEYIARMDADDASMPERFEKQVQFLDDNPNVGVCGSWQQHYGRNNVWVHQAEPRSDVLKARFLFWCDMCHSTLMLRRRAFIENNLFYDPSARAEDYELWTRAVQFMDFANIPEVLGDYNEGSGITGNKIRMLTEESGQISGRFIKRALDINLSRYDRFLLNGWINPISKNEPERGEQLNRLREIFTAIYEKNLTVGFFDRQRLLEVLAAKWFWAKDDIDWKSNDYSGLRGLSDVFVDNPDAAEELEEDDEHQVEKTAEGIEAVNPPENVQAEEVESKEEAAEDEEAMSQIVANTQSIKEEIKSECPEGISDYRHLPETDVHMVSGQQSSELEIDAQPEQGERKGLKGVLAAVFAPLLYPFRKATKVLMRDALREIDKSIENWTWDRYQRTNEAVENWTWDRYMRTNRDVENWTWDRYMRTNRDVENWTWDRYMRTNRDVENWTWDRYMRTNRDVENWTWDRYMRTNRDVENWTWDRYKRTNKDVENWTWERYRRIIEDTNTYEIPYYTGQKIRAAFVCQVASFWPSMEELYWQMKQDDRFIVTLICYDPDFDKSIKTDTTRDYLIEHEYDFVTWEDFSISDFNPHIVFLQTPYDSNRRGPYTSEALRKYGSRVIYIPYGIEIADTIHAHHDHFQWPIIYNIWKMYTFSEEMQRSYYEHIHCATKVEALGLPRFDSLYHRERFPQHQEVERLANGRKVVLWKVHFPKVISELGKKILVTPDINEYIRLAECVDTQYSDLFFVFMPHPRFKEFNDDPEVKRQTRKLMHLIQSKENVFIDDNDDYRPSLLNANAIIVDRSAVMIEAGAVGVPVMYMSNATYYEPMTAAVTPLVESYRQGTSFEDLSVFLEEVRAGIDTNKEQREAAFRRCIPCFDGKCAERIIEDIVCSLKLERESTLESQLANQTAQLEARIARLEAQLHDQANSLAETSFDKVDKSVERWTWDRYRRTRRQNISGLWNTVYEMDPKKMQEIIADSPTYSAEFYWDNRYGSISSAQRILHQVFQWVPHNSVVDFGCGSGTWLWVAQAFGTKEVLGIDGEYVPKLLRMIPEECFMEADLEQRVTLPSRFDLAMTLEVGEHLSPDTADTFVASLCDASDIVLFSAAHPGQGGDNHINEQPLTYWVEKFATHDYGMIDIRSHFEKDNNIETWYRQNIVLFMKEKLKLDIEAKMLEK